jgi:hypothetical protein
MFHSWGDERCVQNFDCKNRRGKIIWKILAYMEVNIKIRLKEIGWEIMDCIHLAWDRDRWPALMNTAVNLRVPRKTENLLATAE